jgi:hypothetical protein
MSKTLVGNTLLDVIMPASDFTVGLNTLSIQDKFEIIELANCFNWCLDTRNHDALGELFTDDGVLDWHFGYGEGKRTIVELFQSRKSINEGVRHQSVNHVVTSNKNGTATMVCYLIVARTGKSSVPGTPYLIGHGIQTFQLKKTNGVWKIARSTLEQLAVNSVDAPDQALREQVAATAETRRAVRS